MNERIRPLYYECQDESQSTEECYQKFAELIIRECANIAMREDHDPYECILKHFGIE